MPSFRPLKRRARTKDPLITSPASTLIDAPLQILLSLDVSADDRAGGTGVLVGEQGGLLLDVVFVFVSEKPLGDGRQRRSRSRWGAGGGAASAVMGEGAYDVAFADGAGASAGCEPWGAVGGLLVLALSLFCPGDVAMKGCEGKTYMQAS